VTGTETGPTVLCDDELLALAHSRQGTWTRPLTTVDIRSPTELSAAVARGYRSLLIRGLLSEQNPDGAELLVPLSLVGLRPGIMATWVTGGLTQAADAERFELFADEAGAFVAVTTRPGGIHAFVPVDGRDGLTFFAELALGHQSGPAPDDGSGLCILVRGADGELVGGFVVRPGQVLAVTRDGPGLLAAGGPVKVGPSVPSWRTQLGELLQGRTGALTPV
jgi:hypothetical protein